MKNVSGAALAAAALTFAISNVATAPTVAAAGKTVMCYGVNSCKGQGACKTASSSCAGMNACKGQGWISTSASNCKKWGGKVL